MKSKTNLVYSTTITMGLSIGSLLSFSLAARTLDQPLPSSTNLYIESFGPVFDNQADANEFCLGQGLSEAEDSKIAGAKSPGAEVFVAENESDTPEFQCTLSNQVVIPGGHQTMALAYSCGQCMDWMRNHRSNTQRWRAVSVYYMNNC